MTSTRRGEDESERTFQWQNCRDRFLTDELWAPTRGYIEQLWKLSDWAETIVAVNVCFEPLVGVLLRREFGIRAASSSGDTITPVVARTGQIEWEWIRGWTVELMRFLLADDEHGEHNRAVIEGWLEHWLPSAREAADAVASLVERLPLATSTSQLRQRTEDDLARLLAEAQLTEAAHV